MKSTNRKKYLPKTIVKLLSISIAVVCSQMSIAQVTFPTDAADLCSFSQSDFSNNMAKITLPTPLTIGPFFDKKSGLVYVFPPQGPSFSSSSHCDFFEWAAQMFLWSTSSVQDTHNVPSHAVKPSSTTPYVFNSEFFYRYANNTLTPQNANGEHNNVFSLRTLKKDDNSQAKDSITQAGSNGVLFSQASNGASTKSSLVYYGVHTNRVLGYTAVAKMQNISGNEFPSDSESVCDAILLGMIEGYTEPSLVSAWLYTQFCPLTTEEAQQASLDLTKMKAQPDTAKIGIPQLEPAIDYLSMVVELKTSWVEADSVANKDEYILQVENVPTYTQATKPDGTSYWKQTGETEKELAMVGMHVVGTVKDHPEMIWATIEHINNAPDADYQYIKTGGSVTPYSPGTAGHWLFSDGTSNNKNEQLAITCGQDICQDVKGKSIAPSNIVRTHPWGVKFNSGTSHTDKAINKKAATTSSQLISMNRNILKQLTTFNANNNISNDPRENYYVSGANWGNNGAIPTSFNSASSLIVGSPYLASSTMESFVQDTGCFGCHSAETQSVKGKTVINKFSTSHIFDKINNVVK